MRLLTSVVMLLFALGVSEPGRVLALATSEAEPQGDDIALVVVLILIVALAYLAAHYVVDWLQKKLFIVSGVEYILLGFMLAQLRVFDDLTGLLPIIALAAGWVGLLRGTDFQPATLRFAPPGTGRIVFLHHIIPGIVVAIVAYFFLTLIVDHDTAAVSAAVLGCCAAADSAEPFDMLGRRYQITGKLAPLLRNASHYGDILIILFFGAIFCLFNDSNPDTVFDFSLEHWKSAAFWMWVMVVVGALLGMLFTPFLGGDESDKVRFLALVGIIAFASGAAYFLRLSPLTVNLLVGMILVNLPSRRGALIHSTLENTERPMALVLLVFAGALWKPTPWLYTAVGIFGFIFIRFFAKAVASLLAGWGTSLRNDLFRGLLAHGEITVAMAISFRLVYHGPAADIAYSIVLGSLVLHDLVAPRALRSLLVDAGDVQHELKETQAATG